MRYININDLKRPENWDERAKKALDDIQQALPEERSKKLKRKSSRDIWKDIKGELAKLSHGKCWYCETRQERSDMVVDHFRPKAGVAESPEHKGYWWLAFDWRNYRYSCTFCNSYRIDPETDNPGGKSTCFPLLDENSRAYSPDDDLNEERLCLLDPTDSMDPMLLWFEQSGEVVLSPCYSDQDNPTRVRESIKIYHLDFSTMQQRRMVLFNDIRDAVIQIDTYFQKGNRDAMKETYKRLLTYLAERAEYSAAARCYLMGLRSEKRPWIEPLLQVH